MFGMKENPREVNPKRHQKLVDELFTNGWLNEESVPVFGEAPFNKEAYLEYVPENGAQVEKEGLTAKKTKAELAALAETLVGQTFPVPYGAMHRCAGIITIFLITGDTVKPKFHKCKSQEEADQIAYDGNRKHRYAVKLKYAEDFREVVNGYGKKFQKESQLASIWPGTSGRGQRQRAWLSARLMDEKGLTFEQASAIPNWKKGKEIEKALDEGMKPEDAIAIGIERVNNSKVMTGKDLREALKLAQDKGASQVVQDILEAIVADQPTTLRKAILSTVAEVEAEAEAEAVAS